MRRLIAICAAAALVTGFCLAAGSTPSYAASAPIPTAPAEEMTITQAATDARGKGVAGLTWSDLPDAVAAGYGLVAAQLEAVSDGYPGGLWKPYECVTRAQFIKMTALGFGIDPVTPAVLSFTDVPEAHLYLQYIEGVRAAGALNGVTPDLFKPDDTITREQAVAITARCLAAANGENLAVTYASDEIDYLLAHFGDGTDVSADLKREIAYAFDSGITIGDANGNLSPFDALTRVEAAALSIRAQESMRAAPPGLTSSGRPEVTRLRESYLNVVAIDVAGATATQTTPSVEPTAITPSTSTTTSATPSSTTTTMSPPTTIPVPDAAVFNLQAAIDACPAGGTVTIPAGTWTIGETSLKSNITIKGAGAASVLVSSASYPLLIEGKSNIVLDSFVLRGSYSKSGQAGICITGGANSNITISNLAITDMGCSGIFLSVMGTLSNSVISGCTITHCGDFGIASRGGGSNVLIENCVLSDFAGVAEPPHGLYFHDINDLTIRGCEAYTLGHHINGYSGLELDNCLRAVVEDCNMHDCQVGSNDDGYGYIAVERTTVTYRNCVGSNNYRDFYECYLTGTATYENCTGTYYVYPS